MKNPSEQLSGILEDFYFFDTIEGIESMPGYVRRVDSSVDKFDDIIGWYQLKDKIQISCQKKDCNTRHGRGYLIRIVSGGVTNIGHVCGEKFDPENFIVRERMAKNKIRHMEQVRYVTSLKNDEKRYWDMVEQIELAGRGLMNKKGRFKMGIENGEKIFGTLVSMAKKESYTVTRLRTLTDEEFEEVKKFQERPSRTFYEEIGKIANGACFAIDESSIYLSAKKAATSLRNIEVDKSTTDELIKVANAVRDIPKMLEELVAADAEFDAFSANQNNMQLLAYII